jgi:hypothetical protein
MHHPFFPNGFLEPGREGGGGGCCLFIIGGGASRRGSVCESGQGGVGRADGWIRRPGGAPGVQVAGGRPIFARL